MTDLITGIQQIGIGVADAAHAKFLYKDLFRMEALIFDDRSSASLMTRYTGNELHDRHAILSMNLSGGGGFEIWQFTSRSPTENKNIIIGDTGIFAAKIKTQDITNAHRYYSRLPDIKVSEISGNSFWVQDQYGNNFQLVESNEWFHSNNHICGGVAGAVIGVTNMEESIEFYRNVLGIHEIVEDKIITANDFLSHGNEIQLRSVVLGKEKNNCGPFSKLLGAVAIELVQPLNREPVKIYSGRFWGDCGFIHLCFDVLNMDDLKEHSAKHGYHFSVDSHNSFAMESSAGRFCYIEDPDGTLIELVETHKIPIFKKLGWHLDLTKRKNNAPLPDWMIKMLGLSKIK